MELATRQWHAPTVELFGLDAGCMPRIVSNSEVVGRVKEGPLAGVPIAGVRSVGGGSRFDGRAAGESGARCSPCVVSNSDVVGRVDEGPLAGAPIAGRRGRLRS